MSPCARWSLPLFISPACIFYSVSPASWSFRLCRRGICLRVPAGPCCCSPHRRAYFIPFPRRSWSFRLCRRRICLRVPAGRCRFHLAGVHFHSESPPSCSSRRLGRRICHRVPAGRCRCSPHRRAFFIANPRRRDHLADGGVEYATVCPLALAVLRLTGVHISSRIPAGMIVSPLGT